MSEQKITRPNFTITPNVVYDVWLREMSEGELRVLMAAVRKIFGWHKTGPEAISISQFMEMTGMSNRAVIDGVESLKSRGILLYAGTGKRGVSLYTLHIEDDGLTSEPSSQVPVNVVHRSKARTSELSSHTKERGNKGKKAAAHSKRTPEQIEQDAIAQAWFDAVGMFGTAPAFYRTEAERLIELDATPELVALMAAEKQNGRSDVYKLAWLVEDWPEWFAMHQRKAREQVEVAAGREVAKTELNWTRELLGGIPA